MNRYFDVILNIVSYSLQKEILYYPLLIVLSFWAIIGVVFLIRYLIRSD